MRFTLTIGALFVAAGTAPEWRKESYERIADSLPEPPPGG